RRRTGRLARHRAQRLSPEHLWPLRALDTRRPVDAADAAVPRAGAMLGNADRARCPAPIGVPRIHVIRRCRRDTHRVAHVPRSNMRGAVRGYYCRAAAGAKEEAMPMDRGVPVPPPHGVRAVETAPGGAFDPWILRGSRVCRGEEPSRCRSPSAATRQTTLPA